MNSVLEWVVRGMLVLAILTNIAATAPNGVDVGTRDLNRDKTGTTELKLESSGTYLLCNTMLMSTDGNSTERGGFEPPLQE